MLAGLAGEDDQAFAISFETGYVRGEGLLGEVDAARVDADADCSGEFAGDVGFLLSYINAPDLRYVFFPFLWSIVWASRESIVRTLSSAREKPRPARTRRLYLIVGQRTIGLSLSTGRGATAAALWIRASRRRDLRPGFCVQCVSGIVLHQTCWKWVGNRRTWSKCVRTRRCQSLRKSGIRKYGSLW